MGVLLAMMELRMFGNPLKLNAARLSAVFRTMVTLEKFMIAVLLVLAIAEPSTAEFPANVLLTMVKEAGELCISAPACRERLLMNVLFKMVSGMLALWRIAPPSPFEKSPPEFPEKTLFEIVAEPELEFVMSIAPPPNGGSTEFPTNKLF